MHDKPSIVLAIILTVVLRERNADFNITHGAPSREEAKEWALGSSMPIQVFNILIHFLIILEILSCGENTATIELCTYI